MGPQVCAWNRRWMAAQIRATADLRSVNFLMGFRSWNGATPANEFLDFD